MTDAAAAAPPGNDASDTALGRLVGVFVSPARTFAAIARKPTWLLPVLIMGGLSLPLSELILSKTDWHATVSSQIAKSGRHLSEQQIDQAVEQAQKISWVWDIIAVVAPLLATIIVAAVYWGGCNAFGWGVKFRQSLGVTAHAFFPGLISSIGMAAVLWNRTSIDPQKVGDLIPTNLGYFAPDADRVTHGLLSSIDLFSFWTMALLVLGLAAAAGAPRKRVAMLVVGIWVLYVLGKAGATALMG